jgi:uncharacterized protein
MRDRLTLGAPGVYRVQDEPVRALTGERMDVAAFVGVAPRGPSRLPALDAPWAEPPRGPAARTSPLRSVAVPVESWDAYRRLYGGFEGPGLLPYAVAAFFEQGGRRAYVVRVVHDHGPGAPENDRGTAEGSLKGAVPRSGAALLLRARDEGTWGNRLRAALSFRTRPLPCEPADPAHLVLARGSLAPPGTLLRVWVSDSPPLLRFVTDVVEAWRPDAPVRDRVATLEAALPADLLRAEVVEGVVEVVDTAPDGLMRRELHDRLAFSPLHPRWMAAVLHRESALVHPHPGWLGDPLDVPDATLAPPPAPPGNQFTCGRDRWADVVADDFFDDAWAPDDEQPRGGVHALAEVDEVSTVVVPDLYSPFPLPAAERAEDAATLAGPRFAPCVFATVPAAPEPAGDPCPDGLPANADAGADRGLAGLWLDPRTDLPEIVALQSRVVALAERLTRWVVLLDVPPGLEPRRVLQWRASFDSPWAAAYHPWLRVSRPDDARDPLVSVPPSAFAAGIVARQELAFGVPHGPGNVIARGPVALLEPVDAARHAALHQGHVNVFVHERDGLRLTAGRTLSRDPRWRQLSVRRLVTMVRLALQRQMQWTVFEPNAAALRDELQRMLEDYLRGLHRASAFRGRSEEEAFFVRCDEVLNPPAVVDAGALVCQVGIAPAEPLEFIVLRLSREGDGALRAEE